MDNIKKCPYCAEDIKAEAIVCRFCGKKIPAAKKSTQPPLKTSDRVYFVFFPLALIVFGCPTSMVLTQDWKLGFFAVVFATAMLVVGVLTGRTRFFG